MTPSHDPYSYRSLMGGNGPEAQAKAEDIRASRPLGHRRTRTLSRRGWMRYMRREREKLHVVPETAERRPTS